MGVEDEPGFAKVARTGALPMEFRLEIGFLHELVVKMFATALAIGAGVARMHSAVLATALA